MAGSKESGKDFEEEFREALKEAGLDEDDYWIKEIKDKLKIKNIRLIRYVKIQPIQEFLENSEENDVEILALKTVIDKMTNVFTREAENKRKEEKDAEKKRKEGEEAEKKRKEEEAEKEKKKKIEAEEEEERQKKKIEEQVKKAEEERKDAKKTLDDRNKKVEGKAQSGFKEHNKNAPGDFGKSSDQIAAGEGKIKHINFEGGTEVKGREKWTASETVRNVQGGILCKGIYLINDIDELLKDRETVLQVPDNLKFKGPVSKVESFTEKFTTQKATQDFENNLDKSSSTKGGSAGGSAGLSPFGRFFRISGEVGYSTSNSKEREKDKFRTKEESFISAVTKEIIPVQSVDMEPRYLALTEEAVDELKKIEAAIKPLNYKSKGHFLRFFERFGSHVNHGVTEFGGILMSKATSQGFKEEDKEKVSNVVSEASETAASVGFSMGGFGAEVGITFSAEKVFAETKGKYHNREVYNTKVTLSKLGGPPELNDKDKWRTGLVEFSSLYRIVRRNSVPMPIWEILKHNKDGFKNPDLLEAAMKEEFSNLTKHVATYKSLDALRNTRDIWLQKYKNLDEKTMVDCMKELESIRKDSGVNPTDWRDEVLYSSQVQEKISTVMQEENEANSLDIAKIFSSLRSILDPINKISQRKFLNIKSIKQVLLESDMDDNITPLEISTFSDLPNVLKESTADQYCDAKITSRRLEEFLLRWKTENKVTEEFLVCICLLNRWGFSFRSFVFEYPVDKKNLEDIIDLLNMHLSELQLLDNKKQKQAYVLDLALGSPQKMQVVQYMMDEMKEVDFVLKKSWFMVHSTRSTKEFEDKIRQYLHGVKTKIDLERLVQKLKAKFQPILPNKLQHHDECLPQDVAHIFAERLLEQMEKLEMTKYFPQKLKYEHVTMLTSDVYQKFSDIPTTLKELPWYFIKHIIGLDSNTRDKSVINEQVDKTSSKPKNTTEVTECDYGFDFSNYEFRDDYEEDDTKETGCDDDSPIEKSSQELHPLDLIYIIFLCADDFLRHELANKMLKNQYAIPLILPATHNASDSESLILHWCLKGISGTFTMKDTVLHKTLVDMETPLISCMSLGKETSWKSRLMNESLSPQQQTFWHQGLAGGNYKQTVSEGMVELAWYLPGGHEDDKFNKAVTFTNLRGDASNHPAVSDKLITSSSATYIFTAKLDKEVFDFVKTRRNDMKKLTLVVLHKDREGKSMERVFKQFRVLLKMTNDQLITGCQDDSNFNIIARRLKESLNDVIEQKNEHMSLSRLVSEIKADDSMEVDDVRCRQGEEAAIDILKDIDQLNREQLGKAKKKILPCQSDLNFREQMAKCDKEICRQEEKKPDQSLQDFVRGIEENKRKLRLEQLHKPISDTFMIFLKYLLNLESTDRKYFLHCLKLGLDKRSEEIMQPLYKTYEESHLQIEEISKGIKELKKKEQEEEINCLTSEVEAKEAELTKLDRQLTYASFGLEHFFRELALVYENIHSLKTQTRIEILQKELANILDALSGIVSKTFLEGTAIEIMDGDAIYVPVVWLNAILRKIENDDKDRVFKMAILGAQSCGKSTILNTVFGLHFPVSSGRCTRGAYMQLVKVEEEFSKTLNCEYILVIDSEGLMARTLTYRPEHDNELATFVLGQSDLTLVVIKGEGKEMEDVLPIAIHVFFRMKEVGELQGCHFVHQNMGSQDAKIKNLKEISDFVATLNEKTRAAAIEAERNDKYKEFTDVLRYDKTKDNTFVPGLWDGSEPMGKINVNYSSTMQQLKREIFRRLVDITEAKSLSTLRDSAIRLAEIWDAIKEENFVFSFKNVLAIETHQQLANVFNSKQWDVKTKIRDQIQKQKITIEKKVQEHKNQSNSYIDNLIDEAKTYSNREIATSVHAVREDIKHYFVCNGQGCTLEVPCSKNVRNRHLIADNKKEFMDDVNQLEEMLREDARASLNTLKTTLKADVQINKMNADMDTRLKKKVKEVVRKEKTKNRTKAEMNQIFNRIWAKETADIMEDVQHEDKDVNIKLTTEDLVLKRLGTNNFLYRNRAKNTGFLVEKHHMEKKGWSPLTSLTGDDMIRLHEVSEGIIRTATEFYKNLVAGKLFDTSDARELIQHVLSLIRKTKDNTFETTVKYKVDLLIHIKNLVVCGVPCYTRKFTDRIIDQSVCSLLNPAECSMYKERLGFVVRSKHVKTSTIGRIFSNKNDAKSRLREKSQNIIRSTESQYSLPPEGKKFVKTDADVLFEKIHRKICSLPEGTPDYQVDLMMYIENLAVKGFTELHNVYRVRSSPKALLEKKRKGYKASFMSLMKQGDSATTFCDSVLRHVVAFNIDERLTNNALFTEVRTHGGEIFRDLRGLQAAIMVDLFQKDEFEGYSQYITYYETVVKKKLNKASIESLTEKDRLHELAYEKLSKITDEIEEAVTATVEGPCDDAHFISTLFLNLTHLRLPSENLASAELLEVTDKRQFGAIVIEQIKGQIEEQIKKEIANWNVEQELEKREWVEFIFDEIVGCAERCPFCRAPCDIHTGGKKSGKHSATLHRPQGLGSTAKYDAEKSERQELVVEDCRIDIESNTQKFRHHKTDGSVENVLCKEYTKVYPDWTIRGDPNPDAEKYWKWVLARYNEEFAEYYQAKKADIPQEWFQYDSNDIKKDIDDHYKVEADL